MLKLKMTTEQIENKITECEKNMDLFFKQLKEQQEKKMSNQAQDVSRKAYQRWAGQHDIWIEILLITED